MNKLYTKCMYESSGKHHRFTKRRRYTRKKSGENLPADGQGICGLSTNYTICIGGIQKHQCMRWNWDSFMFHCSNKNCFLFPECHIMLHSEWRAPSKKGVCKDFIANFKVARNPLKFGMPTLFVLKNVPVFSHKRASPPPPPPFPHPLQ